MVIVNKNKGNAASGSEASSSTRAKTGAGQKFDDADEVEVPRAAGEQYYEEADDPTEAYAVGRNDYQYDAAEAEEEAGAEEEAENEEEVVEYYEEYHEEVVEYHEEYHEEAVEYHEEYNEEYYEEYHEEYHEEVVEYHEGAEADEEAAEYEEEEAAEYGEEEAAEYGEEEGEYGEEEAEYGEEEAAEYGEEEAAEYGEEEAEYGEEEAEYGEEEAEYGEEEAEYGEEAEYEEGEAAEYEEEEAEEYAIEAAAIAGPDGDGATPVSPVQEAPLVVKFNYSEKKRIVMSQLNSVLDNRAEQMRQLQCDEESLSGLTRAVHRINRARLCHVGCKPVTCHDEYCMAAQRLAQQFANYEARYGFNSRLQTELQSYSAVLMLDSEYEQPMLILDEEEDGNETVGLVATRIEFEDFDQLPVESVNMWYQIETPIEFLVASQDDEQRKCAFHYMQLLDCASKRVGWSAVHVGPDTSSGVAYAVAVFDHVIMNVADPLAAVPRKVDSTTFE